MTPMADWPTGWLAGWLVGWLAGWLRRQQAHATLRNHAACGRDSALEVGDHDGQFWGTRGQGGGSLGPAACPGSARTDRHTGCMLHPARQSSRPSTGHCHSLFGDEPNTLGARTRDCTFLLSRGRPLRPPKQNAPQAAASDVNSRQRLLRDLLARTKALPSTAADPAPVLLTTL